MFPNWTRIETALARQGVHVSAEALARAEPLARKDLDDRRTIGTTTDASRGWLFFDLILEHAGIPPSPKTAAALTELHAYHQANNLWELVPAGVRPALAALRAHGLKLVVVSNANGTLRAHMDRVDLSSHVDIVIDSQRRGRREARSAAVSDRARPRGRTAGVDDSRRGSLSGGCGGCARGRAAGGPARRNQSASRRRLRSGRLTRRTGRACQKRRVRLDRQLTCDSDPRILSTRVRNGAGRRQRGSVTACGRCRTGRRCAVGLPFGKTTSTIFSL